MGRSKSSSRFSSSDQLSSTQLGSGQPGVRLLRVGENIRHAISNILARGNIQDDDLTGLSISVSEVRVSPDLRNATVFVIPLGGDEQKLATKALNRNAAFIRGEMSRLVTMKYMPRLKFTLDTSFDEASHIDELLSSPRVARDLAQSGEDISEDDVKDRDQDEAED